MRLRLDLGYEGTSFSGWQRQLNGRSVQADLERALSELLGHTVTVTGAGRTDAGVHARGQVAAFTAELPFSADRLPWALLPYLPKDLTVFRGLAVPDDFDPRRQALAKTYSYRLDLGPFPDPLQRRFSLHYPRPLDLGAMAEAARQLEGEHDFAAFRGAGSPVRGSRRRLDRVEITREGTLVVISFTATGFLYHMARSLTGTLLEVGSGKREPRWVGQLLERGRREEAGPTAPARGLTLERVFYPLELGGDSGLAPFGEVGGFHTATRQALEGT